MKTNLIYSSLIAFAFVLSSCNSDKKNKETKEDTQTETIAHNSMNSLDWDGVYQGILPCADCEGINTTLTINKNKSYVIREIYMGKSDRIFETKGTFTWDTNGQKIIPSDTNRNSYFVGENTLILLDKSGNKITGDLADTYVLKKQNNFITDTKWTLTKIEGKEIKNEKVFIIFDSEAQQVFGSGGCNTFSGSFKLENGQRITLSNIAATLMACPDMTIESEFMGILEIVDNYSINGTTMTLNKAKMAPLAIFEAIE